MSVNNIHTLRIATLALCLGLSLAGCKRDGCMDPSSLNYDPEATRDDGSCQYAAPQAPATYSFSNVSYTGQTVRLLLLSDIEAALDGVAGGTPVTAAQLQAILDNSAGAYSSIATGKNLTGKIYVSAARTAERQAVLDSLAAWFAQVEISSQSGTTVRADGVDLGELIPKYLMAAVLYDQATNNYLELVPAQDNETVTAGEGTAMEHYFDEAYGYLGSPRDLNVYSIADIVNLGSKDSDNNGSIDPKSEKAFFYTITGAKRDLTAQGFPTGSGTGYAHGLFDAFRKGRFAISQKNYAERDARIAEIQSLWDAVIAATVVHYANETKADIAAGSSSLSKHWSEMKGYLFMLRTYPGNKLGAAADAVLNLAGNRPADVGNMELDAIRTQIQNAYGFTASQMAGW